MSVKGNWDLEVCRIDLLSCLASPIIRPLKQDYERLSWSNDEGMDSMKVITMRKDFETESEDYDEEDKVGIIIMLTDNISGSDKFTNGSRKYIEIESEDYHEEDCIA